MEQRLVVGLGALLLLVAGPAWAPRDALAQGNRDSRAWVQRAVVARAPDGALPLTLPEAVALGLRNNRGIRGEYLQRIADRFSLRVAEDSFAPRLTFAAQTSRSRSAGVNSTQTSIGPVVSIDTPTGARFTMSWLATQSNVRGQDPQGPSSLGFQIEQPLLAGAGVDYAMAPRRIARISEQGAKLRLQAQVINQISQVIVAYRTLLQSQEQLRIAQDALQRARQLVEVNRALIAAGRLAQVELIQSEASIAQQELQLIGAQNNTESARLSLLVLMGIDPGSRIWASERPSAPAVRIDLDRALRTAYARQPAYLATMLSIEVQRINLDIARNQRLWDVSIVAGAGQQALRSQVLDTIGALSSVRSDFNIGLRVNIPIGVLSREQQEVNATVALRQSEVAAETARDTVRQQAEDAVRNIEAQRRQAQLAARARQLTAEQLAAELIKLQAGRSSNFQVVSFQSALQQAESAELAAVIAYLNALTAMDQVLGTTLETWRITLNEP